MNEAVQVPGNINQYGTLDLSEPKTAIHSFEQKFCEYANPLFCMLLYGRCFLW
jgi:hypothetical protein